MRRLVELKGGQIEREYDEGAEERHCMETVWECYETETDGQNTTAFIKRLLKRRETEFVRLREES